jgi:hypothetical protein
MWYTIVVSFTRAKVRLEPFEGFTVTNLNLSSGEAQLNVFGFASLISYYAAVSRHIYSVSAC